MQGGRVIPNATNNEIQALVSLDQSHRWCSLGRRGKPYDQASAASSWLRLGFSKCYQIYMDPESRRRCFASVIPTRKT